MQKINNLKILIVGLTSVLALSNFNGSHFQKEKVEIQTTDLNLSAHLISK
ncbi:MAG: hypothetical protein ABI441_04755 [Flavobacterium sp.]